MKRWEAAFRLVGVGWYVGVCIVLGVFGGLWLDKKFNTEPILVIVGLILGIVVAFLGVYNMIRPFIGNNAGDKQNKGQS